LSLIFIISDYQTNTYQLGLLKQNLYAVSNDSKIIDFYHNIRLNNINEAAFILKQLKYNDNQPFIVIAKVGVTQDYIVYQHLLNYFIVPNNGMLSLLFPSINKEKLWKVNSESIALAYQAILDNKVNELSQASNFVQYLPKQSFERGNYLITECIHIDLHGNCYYNLDKATFDRFIDQHQFIVKVQHYSSIITQTVSKSINDIPQGNAGICFIESGFIKLLVNMGSAQKLFRIKENTQLIIEKI
jgi:S-adenosylmethionine hydrolase